MDPDRPSEMATVVLDRARGALLGQLVGDALGTTVEFESAAAVRARYPAGLREIVGGGPFRVRPGQVTDDGELALALARSLAEVGRYDADRVAAAYRTWHASGPFDVGGTIGQAFRGRVASGPGLAAQLTARASPESQANGSLMRISPLGIFGWALPPDELAELAARDSRLSHPHPACQAACAVFTHALALGVRGASSSEIYEGAVAFAAARPAYGWALEVLREAGRGAPADYAHQAGWVRIALQNAFYQLRHAASFEEGLVSTVIQGADADTNGAIAGALLGAAYGEAAIPARWREAVLGCRTTRGPTYQTTDARELAAQLVGAVGRHPVPAVVSAPSRAPSYARELEVVIQAIREAGLQLRAEAERPGGPRGHGGHAPVDEEMGTALCQRLEAAFPLDGIHCEEGGPLAKPTRSGRAFVIDPHDGTSEFLKGRRETSVSVALVDGGRLVLGAVFLPCLAAVQGTDAALSGLVGPAQELLVTWTKGKPLARDGNPVNCSPASAALEAGHVVFVSTRLRPTVLDANRRAFAPARVVRCASIATRLALVAIGVAEVGLTVRNPLADWDFAGGQALLIGAGGELVDERGEPIAWQGVDAVGGGRDAYIGARGHDLVEAVAMRVRTALL